jgi:hypothetical protein
MNTRKKKSVPAPLDPRTEVAFASILAAIDLAIMAIKIGKMEIDRKAKILAK